MITFVHKPGKDLPPLIKVSDVARILSVSRNTIRALVEGGHLEASIINPRCPERHHLRVTRASLLTFYKKRFGHSLLRALEHATES